MKRLIEGDALRLDGRLQSTSDNVCRAIATAGVAIAVRLVCSCCAATACAPVGPSCWVGRVTPFALPRLFKNCARCRDDPDVAGTTTEVPGQLDPNTPFVGIRQTQDDVAAVR